MGQIPASRVTLCLSRSDKSADHFITCFISHCFCLPQFNFIMCVLSASHNKPMARLWLFVAHLIFCLTNVFAGPCVLGLLLKGTTGLHPAEEENSQLISAEFNCPENNLLVNKVEIATWASV